MAEENNWHKYFIHAVSPKEASLLAAEKEFWLHCWDYVYDAEATTAYLVNNPAYVIKE